MAEADPGSFRDETSRVYLSGDRVYRGVDAGARAELEAVMATPFWRWATDSGRVVATEWTDGPPAIDERWAGWLAHDRIPFVSYPYEWSFEMLKAAALLQLELLARGLDDDVMAKDASAYNVQFVGGTPVFIDVGSFEQYRDGDPWYGYRQFCQLFLYPLLFEAYKGLPFQPWLRGAIDGIDPDEARRVLSGAKRHWKGILTHVELHARAEQRMADSDRDVKRDLKSAGFNRRLIEANLAKLRSLVDGLRAPATVSEWSEYSDRGHYSRDDLARKEDVVRAAARRKAGSRVWDLGANDGHFSRIAADHADYVVAMDADRLVVDRLFLDLSRSRRTDILPLVVDLADPSPAIGWRNLERRTLPERGRPDLVLALAVVHHLAIGRNVPLPAIAALFADFAPNLVVEFAPPDDPMVQRLLRGKREGLHADYTVEGWEAALQRSYRVRERVELAGGRILYDVER